MVGIPIAYRRKVGIWRAVAGIVISVAALFGIVLFGYHAIVSLVRMAGISDETSKGFGSWGAILLSGLIGAGILRNLLRSRRRRGQAADLPAVFD